MERSVGSKIMLDTSMEEEVSLKRSMVKGLETHPSIVDRLLKRCGLERKEDKRIEGVDDIETQWKIKTQVTLIVKNKIKESKNHGYRIEVKRC